MAIFNAGTLTSFDHALTCLFWCAFLLPAMFLLASGQTGAASAEALSVFRAHLPKVYNILWVGAYAISSFWDEGVHWTSACFTELQRSPCKLASFTPYHCTVLQVLHEVCPKSLALQHNFSLVVPWTNPPAGGMGMQFLGG